MSTPNNDQHLLPVTHIPHNSTMALNLQTDPFSSKKHVKAQEMKITQRLNKGIIESIQSEIVQSKITIHPPSQIGNIIAQNELSQSKKDEHQYQKLHQIIKRKRELTQEIDRLQYEESRIKELPHKDVDRKMRSEFTREEHENILKALQAQKALDEQLELKNKQMEKEIEAKRQEENADSKKKLEKMNKEKQKAIIQHLKQLEIRKQSREKTIKSLNKHYQQIKASTFLHQKLEIQWKEKEKQSESQTKMLLNERKKKKQFSMKNIIEHQSKYKTFVTINSKEKQQKLIQMKEENEKLEKETLNQYQPSKFLQTIFEEEKKVKQLELEKSILLKNLIEYRVKYGDSIRELHRDNLKKVSLPPIKELQNGEDQLQFESNQQSKPNQVIRLSKSLNRLEIAEIGNRYLREVHSSIGHIEVKPSPAKIPYKEEAKYQDYLQDLKKKRAVQANPELKEIRQLKSVLNSKDDDVDKLYKAKLIAGRIHERTKSDTSKLLASINAKLAIINNFTS